MITISDYQGGKLQVKKEDLLYILATNNLVHFDKDDLRFWCYAKTTVHHVDVFLKEISK